MNEQTTEPALAISPRLTVKSFCAKHDWPEGGLRHLIFHKPDGFERCIRRVGRKILIVEEEFFQWIERINRPVGARSRK